MPTERWTSWWWQPEVLVDIIGVPPERMDEAVHKVEFIAHIERTRIRALMRVPHGFARWDEVL